MKVSKSNLQEDLGIEDGDFDDYDPKSLAKEGLDDLNQSDPDWHWNID